jgi:hypothetical protein
MNDLEHAIVQGACRAQEMYQKMTEGHWLSHAHESFLQVFVALELHSKLGNSVYMDTSVKKTQRDEENPRRGRPPNNIRQRPDISVWYRSSDTLRAIIEAKLTFSGHVGRIQDDATKVETLVKQKRAGSGYLLVYSEANGDEREQELQDRFRHWATEIDWSLLDMKASTSGLLSSETPRRTPQA